MKLYEEIENCFTIIEEIFTEETLLEFKNTPISDLGFYHLGLGMWIRNNLLSLEESRLYGLFLENGVENPDDMSCLIIKLFHYYLSKKTC